MNTRLQPEEFSIFLLDSEEEDITSPKVESNPKKEEEVPASSHSILQILRVMNKDNNKENLSNTAIAEKKSDVPRTGSFESSDYHREVPKAIASSHGSESRSFLGNSSTHSPTAPGLLKPSLYSRTKNPLQSPRNEELAKLQNQRKTLGRSNHS